MKKVCAAINCCNLIAMFCLFNSPALFTHRLRKFSFKKVDSAINKTTATDLNTSLLINFFYAEITKAGYFLLFLFKEQ